MLFRVRADDPAGVADSRPPTEIQRVVIQYDEGHATATDAQPWKKVELHKDSTGDYVGALVTPYAGGRYSVQVLDGAGNVANSSFKGIWFRPGGVAPPQAVAVVTEGTLGQNGWYQSDVTARLFVSGAEADSRTTTRSPTRWP